jgi:hypothetical protein
MGTTYANLRNQVLGDDPPLVDELAWGHLLERRLDGGAHWHLVGRGAREVGIEIDPRVRVQRHHCQVIGLIGHAPVEAAILDHDVGRDMASSLDLFPRQTGGRVADLAGLLRRYCSLSQAAQCCNRSRL